MLVLKRFLVANRAINTVMPERDLTELAIDINTQKPALNAQVAVHVVAAFFTEAISMFVRRGTAGEFPHSGFRVDGGVLPMAITANDNHVSLVGDEFA